MAGTKAGGQRAAATNRLRHGEDFYKKIGSIGGSKENEWKGFGSNRELASIAGQKGGRISKRRKKI